jgi:hypothetical protein
MNLILIEKDGTIFEKNVKTLDKLYSVCGYRTNKDFEKLYEWEFDKNIYELYGKKTGKKDKENIYKLPKHTCNTEKYYGSLCIVKKNSSITLDEWNIFYMSFSSYDNVSVSNKSETIELDSDIDADSTIESAIDSAVDSLIDSDNDNENSTSLVVEKTYDKDSELTYEEYEEE